MIDSGSLGLKLSSLLSQEIFNFVSSQTAETDRVNLPVTVVVTEIVMSRRLEIEVER